MRSSAHKTWISAHDAQINHPYRKHTTLQTTFTRTTYTTFNNQDQTAGFTSTYMVRGVSQIGQVDASGKSSSARTLKWDRSYPAYTSRFSAAAITYSDWWSSASSTTDRLEKYTVGDISNASSALNAVADYRNGFVNTWTLTSADGSTTWATQSRTSQSQGLGHGTGLNNSLSTLKAATSSRLNEARIGTQLTYVDANALQISQTQSLTNSKATLSKAIQYDNRWSMLQPGEVNQVAETRLNVSSAPIAPGAKTATSVWDTANPPLLQLQKSYQDSGTIQHGQQFTYDSEGRISTQAVFHVEGGATANAPNTLTTTYDTATGEPTLQSTAYVDGSSTGTVSESKTDFDAAHRPTTLIDAKGVTTKLAYDLYGRVTSLAKDGEATITKSYPDFWTTVTTQGGKTTTVSFDGFGRVIKTVLPTGVIQVPTYDPHSRLVTLTETNAVGSARTSTVAYDLLDRKTTETSITGKRVDYVYSTDGTNNLITQTVDPSGLKLVTATKIDPWGQIISVTAPNGDTTTYDFDGWGNKTRVIITPADSGTPQVRSFVYDALGRLKSKTEPETGTQTFTNFNALNQAQTLTEAGINTSLAARVRTLVYDGLGRLHSQSSGSTTENFVYQGAFLTSSSRTAGAKTVTQTYAYKTPGAKPSGESTTVQ